MLFGKHTCSHPHQRMNGLLQQKILRNNGNYLMHLAYTMENTFGFNVHRTLEPYFTTTMDFLALC